MKFKGIPEAQSIIRGQKNPSVAAFFGRSSKMTPRVDWDLVKDSVMEEAVQLKFDRHPQLKEQLLATSDWKLVEKTNDFYWGNGGNGTGLNKLGKLLEQVRENRYIQKNTKGFVRESHSKLCRL